jgi:hypothetical protein
MGSQKTGNARLQSPETRNRPPRMPQELREGSGRTRIGPNYWRFHRRFMMLIVSVRLRNNDEGQCNGTVARRVFC